MSSEEIKEGGENNNGTEGFVQLSKALDAFDAEMSKYIDRKTGNGELLNTMDGFTYGYKLGLIKAEVTQGSYETLLNEESADLSERVVGLRAKLAEASQR